MSRNGLGWQNRLQEVCKKMKEMRFKRQFYNPVFLIYLLTVKIMSEPRCKRNHKMEVTQTPSSPCSTSHEEPQTGSLHAALLSNMVQKAQDLVRSCRLTSSSQSLCGLEEGTESSSLQTIFQGCYADRVRQYTCKLLFYCQLFNAIT